MYYKIYNICHFWTRPPFYVELLGGFIHGAQTHWEYYNAASNAPLTCCVDMSRPQRGLPLPLETGERHPFG